MFQKHALLCKALKPLLSEHPENIAICVFGDTETREANACASYYVTLVNATELPSHKKDKKEVALKNISIYGYQAAHDTAM
jgi:leucyl aminopeptidase